MTDHCSFPGCRPARNIDVLRVIGVCETPEQLEAAVQNLGLCFGGAGRIKNNFAVEDASYMFHLTTILLNVLVEFDCTFAQLAARPGVAEQWAAHIDAAERGNVPRAQLPPPRGAAAVRGSVRPGDTAAAAT